VGDIPYFQGPQRITHWRSSPSWLKAGQGTTNGSFVVFPMDPFGDPFPGLMVASSMAFGVSFTLTATSVSQQLSSSMRIGLYTRSVSTLNLLNSALLTFGNSNASTANTSNWNGMRFLQLTTGHWSAAPLFVPGERYFLAVQFLSTVTTAGMSIVDAVSMTTAYSGRFGATNNATYHPTAPFRGVFNATTNAVPTTIQASQVSGTGANGSFYPWLRLDENLANY
jgi:hypothetical protein